jgi:outer membrane lipopolysaccharide assembly protein LptE/RlpB
MGGETLQIEAKLKKGELIYLLNDHLQTNLSFYLSDNLTTKISTLEIVSMEGNNLDLSLVSKAHIKTEFKFSISLQPVNLTEHAIDYLFSNLIRYAEYIILESKS